MAATPETDLFAVYVPSHCGSVVFEGCGHSNVLFNMASHYVSLRDGGGDVFILYHFVYFYGATDFVDDIGGDEAVTGRTGAEEDVVAESIEHHS